MGYRYDDSDVQRPTFHRTSGASIFAAIVFGLLAVGGLTLGALASMVPDMDQRVPIAFLAIGGGFASALVLFATRVQLPRSIIFDTTRGVMRVNDDPRAFARGGAELPLTDIERFAVRKVVRSSGQNSRPSVSYQVEARKRDGAIFGLWKSRSEDKAKKLVASLTERVNLEQSAQTSSAAPSTTSIMRVEEKGDELTVSWGSRTTVLRFLATWVAIVCFGGLFGAVAWTIHWGAGGFVSLFGGLLVITIIWNQLRTVGARYVVKLGASALSYGWQGGLLGRKLEEVDIKEIGAVSFSFSTEGTHQPMLLLTVSEMESLKRSMGSDSPELGDLFGMAMQMARARSLDTVDLRFGDKVQLERLLQDGLRARGVEVA